MTALRPKSISFSQAEILRAYALQLHLKQIARLLRASRVETSEVVGERQKSKPVAERIYQPVEEHEKAGESE